MLYCKMTDQPTIWIVNRAGHPYELALEVVPGAELKSLTIGDVNPLRVDRLVWHLARGVVLFSKSEDYLLISGTPILSAISLVIWLVFHQKAKILQWDAKKRVYVLSTVTLDQIKTVVQRELERS